MTTFIIKMCEACATDTKVEHLSEPWTPAKWTCDWCGRGFDAEEHPTFARAAPARSYLPKGTS